MIEDGTQILNEVLTDPTISVGSLAVRVRKSERLIRMTLLLAFLAPDLAKAATEGSCDAGSGSSGSSICQCFGPSNGASWVCFLEKLAGRGGSGPSVTKPSADLPYPGSGAWLRGRWSGARPSGSDLS